MREIGIKVGIDSGKSVEEIKKLESGLKGVNQEAEKIDDNKGGKDFAAQLASVNKEVKSGELGFRQLRKKIQDYQSIALAAGRTSPIGKEALSEAAALRDQLDDLDKEVKNLATDGQALQGAMQLGQGVVAGFAAFKGITAALGIENEDLQKTLVKLQGAQAALMGLERLHQLLRKESTLTLFLQSAATKVATAATAAYSFVVGSATGALKLFRIALAATGIGLIILGITLLITNFEKIIDAVGKFITYLAGLKEALLFILPPVWLLIKAYEALFGSISDGINEQKQMQLEANQQSEELHKANIKRLESERDAQLKVVEEIQNKQKVQKQVDDLAILQAKARGASETEIFNLQKQQNEIKLQMAQQEYEAKEEVIRINHELAEAEFNRLKAFLETQALQNGWTEQQRQKDLQRLEDAKTAYLEDEQLKRDENLRTVKTIEAQNKIFIDSKNKSTSDSKKKEEDAKKKELDNKLKLEKEYEKKLADLKISNIKDDQARETAALEEKYKREREALIEKFGEGTELEKQLAIQHQTAMAELEDKFYQAEFDALEKSIDAENALKDAQNAKDLAEQEARLAAAELAISQAQLALDTMTEVNNLINQLGANRMKENEQRRDEELDSISAAKKRELNQENLSARQKAIIEAKYAQQEYKTKLAVAEANDKIAKRAFERNKALQISNAVINTASGVLQAVAQFGPPPSPLGIAGIAAAGIIGAAQIATIASTKFEGSAASISPPDISIPSADSGGGSDGSGGSGNQGSLNQDQTTETDSLLNKGLTVSIVEIESVNKQVKEIDDISTIG